MDGRLLAEPGQTTPERSETLTPQLDLNTSEEAGVSSSDVRVENRDITVPDKPAIGTAAALVRHTRHRHQRAGDGLSAQVLEAVLLACGAVDQDV